MLALTSVVPTEVPEDGGYLIRILGDFSDYLGQPFQVHIGSAGDATDDAAESGVPGQAQIVYPLNADEIRCYSPPLDPGTYDVFVRLTDNSDSDSLVAVFQTFPKGFETSVYDLRRVLPPYYLVGPRSIEQEETV